jgi:GNAT superfamily N-acetyltransferase
MTWYYELVKAEKLEARELDRIKAIYEASFSPSLRESFPALMEPVMTGRAALYLASAKGRIGGFALASPLGMTGVNYLAYLAVDSDQRGQGIGGALFRLVLEDAYRLRGDTELLWEVERPPTGAGPKDLNLRRIAFYERLGAVLLDLVRDFRMPNLAGPGTVPAALMWTSVLGRPKPAADEIETYVVALFGFIYGRGQDDPLVAAVLNSIEGGA